MAGESKKETDESKKNREPRKPYDSRKRGIYSIETNWYEYEFGQKDATSIRPILQLLSEGYWEVPFISRDAATNAELFHYLNKWLNIDKEKEGNDFPVLYLGFHGSEGGYIWLEREGGESDNMDCERLGEYLEGKCKNKIVHFAGCSIIKELDIKSLLESTGAVAISGYKRDIYCDSYAFEFLYLQYLQYFGGDSLTAKVAQTVRDDIKERFGKLGKYFEFEMHINGDKRKTDAKF